MPVAAAPVNHQPLAAMAASRPERAVVQALNRARAEHGLPRLALSGRLTWVAGAHSRDLVRHDMLSHDGSDGTPFATRVKTVTKARVVGETIAASPPGSRLRAQTIVRLWLRSPAHRVELLSRSFRRVGVGRATGRGGTVVTADFASAY